MRTLRASGYEGNAHFNRKESLAAAIKRGMDWLYIHYETMDGIQSYRLRVEGLKPLVECSYPHIHENITASEYAAVYGAYPEMIFDIGLTNEAGTIIAALEVSNSHWLDERKVGKLTKAGIVTIEVSGRIKERHEELDRVLAKSMLIPRGHALTLEIWSGARWVAA